MSFERLAIGTIRCVHEVLASKSVTIAAERIGVSQSAVSQQIARFEKLTGIAIVARNGAKMAVCSDEMARHVEAMMESIDAMRNAGRDKAENNLRLGMCDSIASYYCNDVEQYVKLNAGFQTHVGRPSGIADMFNSGDLDIVIRPLFHHEAEIDFMFEVPLIWAASRKLEMRRNASACPEPLPVILEATPSPFSYYAERFLRENQIDYKVVARTDDNLVRMRLLAAGIGCSAIPEFVFPTVSSASVEKILPVTESKRPNRVRFGLMYNKKNVTYKVAERAFEDIREKLFYGYLCGAA
ncbi:DNA-binding transcriptional regulator HcaR [compost metagenome]